MRTSYVPCRILDLNKRCFDFRVQRLDPITQLCCFTPRFLSFLASSKLQTCSSMFIPESKHTGREFQVAVYPQLKTQFCKQLI